jgi:hypothetical protein
MHMRAPMTRSAEAFDWHGRVELASGIGDAGANAALVGARVVDRNKALWASLSSDPRQGYIVCDPAMATAGISVAWRMRMARCGWRSFPSAPMSRAVHAGSAHEPVGCGQSAGRLRRRAGGGAASRHVQLTDEAIDAPVIALGAAPMKRRFRASFVALKPDRCSRFKRSFAIPHADEAL